MSTTADILNSRVLQAVVAGGFVAIGWMVNGWQNRRVDRRRRAERLRDVHRALFAEIGAYLASIGDLDQLEAGRAAMVARMEAEPDFLPFLASEEKDSVYRAIIGEIHVLPRSSVDIVVAFYTQLNAIRALVDDMRSDRFAALAPERRLAVYEDYIRMTRLAFEYGSAALHLIDVFAKQGKDAARAEQDRLREMGLNNQPAADRYAP